ncbi:MAG: hypothetical protein ABIG28_01365 [archaeon]
MTSPTLRDFLQDESLPEKLEPPDLARQVYQDLRRTVGETGLRVYDYYLGTPEKRRNALRFGLILTAVQTALM